MAQRRDRTDFIPLDDRDPATVRTLILARDSDTSARAEDLANQVRLCEAFIANMGWPTPTPDHILIEVVTGMKNVERPIIDRLMAIIARGEVDVIIAREFERVARREGRRTQIIETAKQYGIEFRFTNRPETHGKLPDDPMSRLYLHSQEVMAEVEAEKITERMGAYKRQRLMDGAPQAGRGGAKSPLYGYTEGERTPGKHGSPKGMKSFRIHEENVAHVLWLYRAADEADPAELNIDSLARQLGARGAKTAGGGPWTHNSVRRILENEKYCGRGRNGRFWAEWVQKKDPDTGRVSEHQVIHDRKRELSEAEYLAATYPTAEGAYPPIIDPELFDRVQEKLKAARALHYRGARENEAENATLLNNGYVRCAECGGRMIRYWPDSRANTHYLCRNKAAHPKFSMRARQVDDLALRLLARGISEPEQLLELAAAAEQRYPEAEATASLAQVDDITYKKRLAKLGDGITNLNQALRTLSAVPGMDDQIASVRERLEQLRAVRAEVETEHTQTASHRESALGRRDFLQKLFTVRGLILDLDTSAVTETEEHLSVGLPAIHLGPDGKPVRYASLPLCQAAALLSISEADVATVIPVEPDQVISYETGDVAEATDTLVSTVDLADVLYFLLTRQSRERLRRLLHNLDAVVLVGRGYTRAEYERRRKAMPPKRRVRLQLYGMVELSFDQDDDDDGADGPGGISPQGPFYRTEVAKVRLV